MDESTLFFDSYAIIESIKGNPNYKKYENVKMVTTKLNLFEVCYFLIRDFGEEKAREFIEEHIDSVADFDVNVILYAAKLKLDRKKETLSMVDCIGYILAKSLGLKFLTGDKKFENIENVEYIK